MKTRQKHNGKFALRDFLILWSTQSFSQLGSSMTAFALTLWLCEETGSALSTAALSVCFYGPYVLMSILAGALVDRLDKKRTMLVCDLIAAFGTVVVYALFRTRCLAVWQLYVMNGINGLMNTLQQPASEVAMTLIVPEKEYQRAGGLRSLSRSLIDILHPLFATALYSLAGLTAVIAVDLGSFAVAFAALLFGVRIPENRRAESEPMAALAREGLVFLSRNPLILKLILFMAGVNLTASAFDAALPGYVIPNPRGGASMLGIVTSCAGIAMVAGSLLVSVLPKPKDRVRVIRLTMLFSLGSENFLLAFSREPALWCAGQIIGWILVPVMDANLDVLLRTGIPVELQGRVYACRNTLQFFTIPAGLLLGGFLVDRVCEPFMAAYGDAALLKACFGSGKGSGAALVMFILGVCGSALCLMSGGWLRREKRRTDLSNKNT